MGRDPITSDAPQDTGVTRLELAVGGFALGWAVLFAALLWGLPVADGLAAPLGGLVKLLAVFMPPALMLLALALARMSRKTDSLMRQLQLLEARSAASAAKPVVKTGTAHATPLRPAGAAQSREQRSLPLEPVRQAASAPLTRADFISAMNFPDDENDAEGFAALRRALRDPASRGLVQASQDVLTLLSQDGIYMDDLPAPPPDPALWRAFADGARGDAIAGMASGEAAAHLEKIKSRMRADLIFRDAVHHFLRRFDTMLVSFAPDAADADLAALAQARTGRAFVMLGRATGVFD